VLAYYKMLDYYYYYGHYFFSLLYNFFFLFLLLFIFLSFFMIFLAFLKMKMEDVFFCSVVKMKNNKTKIKLTLLLTFIPFLILVRSYYLLICYCHRISFLFLSLFFLLLFIRYVSMFMLGLFVV